MFLKNAAQIKITQIKEETPNLIPSGWGFTTLFCSMYAYTYIVHRYIQYVCVYVQNMHISTVSVSVYMCVHVCIKQ
jgi:hypothetical protein